MKNKRIITNKEYITNILKPFTKSFLDIILVIFFFMIALKTNYLQSSEVFLISFFAGTYYLRKILID